MAWFYNDGTPYDGPVHALLNNTFSGATRTPESRRLVEGEAVVQPSSKQKPSKSKGGE
jgi:hypothetical protein